MAKRRLPVLNSPSGVDPQGEATGSVAAWAGVTFFCTALLWVPAAWLAGAFMAALGPRLGASHDVLTASAIAAMVSAQAVAYVGSVAAGSSVVARFGPARPGRAAYLGVGALVVGALTLAAAQEPGLAMTASVVLVPLGLVGVRIGLRVGRHKRAKGI